MGDVRYSWSDGVLRGVSRAILSSYPSGEPLVTAPAGWESDGSFYVDRIMIRSSTTFELMAGLFFADALRERGNGEVDLILPFVPGSRQDRMSNEGDFLFTAKSVAKEINARGFRRVAILDPHSEVISALIDRCRVVHAVEACARWGAAASPHSTHFQAIASPDAGAEKRAGLVAKRLGLPLLHGWKTRDVRTGKISGFGLEPTSSLLPGSRILVVDDICDGGGTFAGLSGVLSERGLKADLYVTHGIFSKGTKELLDRYFRIVATDSVVGEKPGVEVIPICEDLLKAGL